MPSWGEFERDAPEAATLVRESFARGRHCTMATLRADGSPRISGTEVQFIADELWIGSMPSSRKAADLRHDARVAIHSPSPDPSPQDHTDWVGDAKVAGRAVEVTDEATRTSYLEALQALMPEVTETAPSEANDGGSDGADGADRPDDEQGEQAGPELEFDLFRIDIAEAVSTRIGDPADHLVLTVWHETRGTQTIRRT